MNATLAGLAAWFQERFPPVVYTVLVGVFASSGLAVAGWLGEGDGSWPWLAFPLVWLVFLRLRLFDEGKDFAEDVVLHPERVLSRGLVSLDLLTRLGWGVLLAEGLLAALIGRWTLVAWAGTALFTLGMRVEFGVGRFLRQHLLLYALTHNPVVAGLTLILAAAAGAGWSWDYLWYVAVASLGSLGFELGRKLRRPEEEQEGLRTYSSVLGSGRARALLGLVYLGLAGAVIGLGGALGAAPLGSVGGAALALAPGLATLGGGAKAVEGGSSGALLLSMVVSMVLGV
ncbi:MAG: hypothetical protein JXX28_04780 [Deltaproteobacteria bacterium]|nr:hypothetical protein [Deltaproteobacteria bacterium]